MSSDDLLLVRHLDTLLWLQQFTQSVRLSLVYFTAADDDHTDFTSSSALSAYFRGITTISQMVFMKPK